MNRRDIFKGAAGAGAAAVLATESNMTRAATSGSYPSYPIPQGPTDTFLERGLNPIPDPFHAAKQLLVKHATDQRELLQEQLDRKRESLSRMKSVSEAYKWHMLQVYRKEAQAINQRWERYVNGIWGHKS